MREVDRLMIEELHIELLQMMENAGRALAEQARQLVGGDVHGAQVIVLAGRGGNGGGGLTAGRRLAIWGADVSVILGAARHEFQGVPLHRSASSTAWAFSCETPRLQRSHSCTALRRRRVGCADRFTACAAHRASRLPR
jgi:NAD(P)H-hydrate repair Nnr-like enzyme with NAD(P)H-hydrate epimerase domain